MGTKVEEILTAVLAALEEGGYGKKSIGLYRYMFGQPERLAPHGVYTPEVGAAFAAEAGGPRAAALSKDRTQAKRRIVRLADEYAATGTFQRSCDERTERSLGARRQAFFCTVRGTPVSVGNCNVTFRRIWEEAGLPAEKGGRRPTPYAFRHRFAYANLERWASEGRDVDAMLHYLSRYMGHAAFSSTYYYVHVSPDFMSGYADAVSGLDDVLPGVGFDA